MDKLTKALQDAARAVLSDEDGYREDLAARGATQEDIDAGVEAMRQRAAGS